MASADSRKTTNGGRPPSAWRVLAGFLALLLFVATTFWALTPPGRGPARRVAEAEGRLAARPPTRIVGDRVCQECHADKVRQHERSGHSQTLRPAAEVELARWLDGRSVADPERPEVRWTYSLRDGRLGVDRSGAGHDEKAVLEYALGSGRHAMTFVSLTEGSGGSPGSREHRLTYFEKSQSLEVTPGQKASEGAPGTNPMGRDRGPGETVHCFGCHSTTVSDTNSQVLDTATLRPNIHCERCHGPGLEHVEAARRGASDLTLPFGKVWTAEGQMKLCGDCHRHPSQAPPGEIRADNPSIARFQPVGLMQSRCYTRSDGELSCVNCHNPHDRASTDQASYETACLQCHQGGRRTACRVSPRDGCIKCHMPKIDAGQGVLFADHWIRVRRDQMPIKRESTSIPSLFSP